MTLRYLARYDPAWSKLNGLAVRENQYPSIQPFYYAAEKPDAESCYPPARRACRSRH